MMFAALSLKHPSFADEQEWRLVTSLHADDPEASALMARVGFRTGCGIVRPYLDLPVSPSKGHLPIAEVVFGPTLRPVITRESIEFFLTRQSYSKVVVKPSGVPLQA